ncbi:MULTISPECIES: hypothetical protein [unclassified Sphingomonas]|uniref:hypothetical protein n=1 Tax=unclassified Sphingomonas TaxID=196159 RepID=UPI001F5955E9|nr:MULTISPECIES: hypothetical protein [unclassified Sphingomonas]
MAAVDGSWDTIVKSPLGDQKAVLTVKTDGDSWTGSQVGAMGAVDITDGKVEGDTIKWTMSITVPMPMSLDCSATAEGDTLTGTVGAGAFGSFPMTGTRQA